MNSQECLLLDKTITNSTFSPLLLHGHKWPNYKKRLAIWKNTLKAYKMSEMHIGALVAISMTDSCKLRVKMSWVKILCILVRA